MESLVPKLIKRFLRLKFYDNAIFREDSYDSIHGGIITNTRYKSIYSKEDLIFDKYYYLKLLGTDIDDFSIKSYSIDYLTESIAHKKLITWLDKYISRKSCEYAQKVYKVNDEYLTITKFIVVDNEYETRSMNKDIVMSKISSLYESYKLIHKLENEYTKKSKE